MGNVAHLQLLKTETFFPSPCKNIHKVQFWNTNAQASMSWKDRSISPVLMDNGQSPQCAKVG